MSNATNDKYSHLARVLHWASAAVVLWATLTGVYAAVWADAELRDLIAFVNVSLTTLLIPVFALRVGHRLMSRKPAALAVSGIERRAAAIGHFALYALTAVVLASGVLMMERDIEVFGWVSFERPIADPAVNLAFGLVHRATTGLLSLMVLIHVAAVVRHHRRGIQVLARMTWSRSSRTPDRPFRDRGGRAVFARGRFGAAHVLAHRLADAGEAMAGRYLLGRWLDGRSGSGSDWVHLHFHLASFELATGDWDAAYERFIRHILLAAATTEDALTDAPALLWRLQLSAPKDVELPWQVLRRTALKRMQRPCDPFVQLHNLLALAGAGDLARIDRWLNAQPVCDDIGEECLLRRAVMALRAYAGRTYRQAAEALHRLLPLLPRLGGSAEQNRLFVDLARASQRSLIETDLGRA